MCIRCLALPFVALLFLPGCRDREVQAYRVPKEQLPAAPASAPAGTDPHGHGAHGVSATTLAWTAPAQWQEKPAAGFRRGSFTVPGEAGADADLSIIAFPGSAGGMADNFNRWRGQLGLPSASEAEVMGAVLHFDGRGGLHYDVVDYAGVVGEQPTRILGAVAQVGSDSWFFKLMGPDALVAAQRETFLEFLHTVRPASP